MAIFTLFSFFLLKEKKKGGGGGGRLVLDSFYGYQFIQSTWPPMRSNVAFTVYLFCVELTRSINPPTAF